MNTTNTNNCQMICLRCDELLRNMNIHKSTSFESCCWYDKYYVLGQKRAPNTFATIFLSKALHLCERNDAIYHANINCWHDVPRIANLYRQVKLRRCKICLLSSFSDFSVSIILFRLHIAETQLARSCHALKMIKTAVGTLNAERSLQFRSIIA